jgi:hypothetical protein
MEGTFGRDNLSLQFAAPLFMFLENLIIVIAMHASTRTPKKKANAMLYEHMEKQRCSTITKYLFVLQE